MDIDLIFPVVGILCALGIGVAAKVVAVRAKPESGVQWNCHKCNCEMDSDDDPVDPNEFFCGSCYHEIRKELDEYWAATPSGQIKMLKSEYEKDTCK